MAKAILTATHEAITQLRRLMEGRGVPSAGVRVSVRTRGCTGRSYALSFVDRVDPMDQVCSVAPDVTLFIDPKALMFLVGTKMDYYAENIEEGFVFQNPNEKGRCGCGESFYT